MARKTRSSSPKLGGMKPYTKSGEPVSMLTDEKMSGQTLDRFKSWTTFYRHNMSFFVEHYMGVHLHFYQRVWINWIASSTEFLGIASRASAKSWLIAVYGIARCILYPGTTVVLASSTKAQAGLIISEKCKTLHDTHTNIQRETVSITTNQNKWEMAFKNGSKIHVVVSGESGRGNRANVIVLEERRLIPKDVIDSIIRPFSISRQPPYMQDGKYAGIEDLQEEPQEIIITSAYYKSYDWYPEAKRLLRKIAAGDPDVKGIFLDYLVLIKYGIKTKKQMIREKEGFEDSIAFLMEYGNIPYGASSKAFFDLGLFNRNIKRAWRPVRDEIYLTTKKNPYDIPKRTEELRVVAVDVAMRAGAKNDNTIISCARLFPSRRGWQTDYVYMESHNGKNTALQALRIKQICTEFEADVLVLDIQNQGISVFDALSAVTKDETRGVEYPGYTIMNSDAIDVKVRDELSARTLAKDAKAFIFPISATQQLNSIISVSFRERMKKKLINFLVDDNTEEEFLIKSGNKDIIDQDEPELRAYLLQAHLQTTLMINECIGLDMDMVGAGGLVKLVEPPGARKDRYTSCSYLSYYVSLLDTELLRETYSSQDDEEEFLAFSRVF